MNENTKTVLFVFAAALVAVIAWAARPRLPGFDEVSDVINQPLFPEFDKRLQADALAASSLEIIQFDEQSGRVKPFKVAQIKTEKGLGRWAIPSHENYPADAKEHLAEAAASLTDLRVLGKASDNRGDFELYGVVDPTSKDLKPGAPGIGTRVTLRDKDNQVLVDLIVGKEVPGAGKEGSEQKEIHYVRRPDGDPIYEVKLKTDKLSSNFGDWIEKDLLKMSTWEIKGIQVQDYSVDAVAGTMLQRGQMALEYNDSGDPRWKFAEDKIFQNGKWVSQSMAPDEEMNTQKLDDMKFALGDLKIVDVNRKPPSLTGKLRDSGTLRKDRASVESLAQRGFYPVRMQGYEELLSSEGEIRAVMKDGVVYILRFGQIAGTTSSAPKKNAAKDKTDDKDKTPGVNRYLFVMAEFNPDVIEKPKFDPVPPEPKPTDAKAAPKKEEAKKEEGKKDQGKKEEGKKDEGKKDDKPDPKAERERIEKENKKKKDEYDEKIKKGEEHVKELNGRFAEWYYVIADDTYQKIHLSRKDMVKKKEKKEEEKKEGEKKAEAPKVPANTPAELEQLKKGVPAPKAPEAPKAAAPAAMPAAPAAPAPKTPPAAPAKTQAAPPAPAKTPAAAPLAPSTPAPAPAAKPAPAPKPEPAPAAKK